MGHPLPFTTGMSHRNWADFKSVGGRRGRDDSIDLLCAFANTMLRPLAVLLPPLGRLADEVHARHDAIVRGEPAGVVQLSFSCAHAWLRAAVPTELRPWVARYARHESRNKV